MQLFEVVFDEDKDAGVYALSVVEDPAMEGFFVALKEDQKPQEVQMELSKLDEDQHILLGVALIPNKPIYRNQGGKEFYIQFSADTIKQAAHSFLKNQYNNNSSIEHQTELSGMSVVESWVVEDPEYDKSKKYGMSYPAGSWMVAMKVDNDEIWQEYVKTGRLKGFSIDGLFSLKEIKLKTEIMDSTNKITEAIEKGFESIKGLFLSGQKPEQVKLATATLADGETTISWAGDDPVKLGDEIFVETPDGQIPAPDAQHELESGVIVTTVAGIVTQIIEDTEEAEGDATATAAERAAEEVAEVAMASQEDKAAADKLEEFKAELTKYQAQFKAELEAKDKEIEELKAELSSTPAAKPKKHSPIEVTLAKPKNRKERLQRMLSEKRDK